MDPNDEFFRNFNFYFQNPFGGTYAAEPEKQGTYITAKQTYDIRAGIREFLVRWSIPASSFLAEKLTELVVAILEGSDKKKEVIDMRRR